MLISIVSFGYKYGLPIDADLVMDVRFMPNPNYVPALKHKTGMDAAVGKHILKAAACGLFLSRFSSMIRELLPHYISEGKSYLTIAIGCTGGRHRSVFITRQLSGILQKEGYAVREFHRDIQK